MKRISATIFFLLLSAVIVMVVFSRCTGEKHQKKHASTADSLKNAADLSFNNKEYRKASGLYQEALIEVDSCNSCKLRIRLCNEQILINSADSLFKLRKYAESEKRYKEVLTIDTCGYCKQQVSKDEKELANLKSAKRDSIILAKKDSVARAKIAEKEKKRVNGLKSHIPSMPPPKEKEGPTPGPHVVIKTKQ